MTSVRVVGRPFLLGDELGIADVSAFPVLKYPALGIPPGDADPFHRVLAETMPAVGPRVRAWIERVDAYPRA